MTGKAVTAGAFSPAPGQNGQWGSAAGEGRRLPGFIGTSYGVMARELSVEQTAMTSSFGWFGAAWANNGHSELSAMPQSAKHAVNLFFTICTVSNRAQQLYEVDL
jgi:hypothetical protein